MSDIADPIDLATTPPSKIADQPDQSVNTTSSATPDSFIAPGATISSFSEWAMRIGVWGVIFFAFTRYISQLSGLPASILNIALFSSLSALILFATTPTLARWAQCFADAQPIVATLLPLVMLIPLSQLMQPDNRYELSEILLTAIVFLLPVALAVLNTPAFRWGDLTMGWFAVIVPLLLPFTRIAPVDPPQTTARLIVGVLPLILVFFTTRSQKLRLNYLFICAILSLWATFELGVLPLLASDPSLPLPLKSLLPGGYLQLGLLVLGFYIVLIAGKFNGLGFLFSGGASAPSSAALPKATWFRHLIELIIVVSVATALMWMSRAYHMTWPTSLPAQALPNLALFFLLSALPAELLFRGVLLRYLRDALRLPSFVAVVLSALVFTIAALPNLSISGLELPTINALVSPITSPIVTNLPVAPQPPPSFLTRATVEFLLNMLMGVFYARLYLHLRNLPLVALVHAVLMWLYWLFSANTT